MNASDILRTLTRSPIDPIDLPPEPPPRETDGAGILLYAPAIGLALFVAILAGRWILRQIAA